MLDNGFDFKVRDELRNVAFDKRLWMENIRFFKNCGHGCQTSRNMLLDMIIFASFGDEELAETNIHYSETLLRRCVTVVRRSFLPFVDYVEHFMEAAGVPMIFNFWRMCFIKTKLSVDHKEDIDTRYAFLNTAPTKLVDLKMEALSLIKS